MPTLERGDRLVRLDVGQPAALLRPGRRPLDHGEEVDVLAVAADRVVQQVRVRAHPELDRLGIGEGGKPIGGHDAAEGARPRVDRLLAAGHPAAHQRAHAVRADHQVRLHGPAVGEREADRVALLDEVGEPVPEMQPGGAERAAEDALEIGAMDAEVGGTEAAAIGRVLAHGKGRDATAVPPTPVDQLGGFGRDGRRSRRAGRGAADPGRVGGQRHRRADFGQLGGLLEDIRRHAALPQREREGQPANAAAGDGHPKVPCIHGARPFPCSIVHDRWGVSKTVSVGSKPDGYGTGLLGPSDRQVERREAEPVRRRLRGWRAVCRGAHRAGGDGRNLCLKAERDAGRETHRRATMSTITKKLSAGLVGLLLVGAALGSAGPALAGGHGGGFGRHGGGWGHGYGWGYGYAGYAPVYYGGCYLKRFVTLYGDIVYRKVCS